MDAREATRREQMAASIRDKAYRDIFVQEEIDTGLPFQIRAMRRARGWSQKELAARLGVSQSAIGRWERLDYGHYTIATLKRLASAFDVALAVRFESFDRCLDYAATFGPDDLAVPPYATENDSRAG